MNRHVVPLIGFAAFLVGVELLSHVPVYAVVAVAAVAVATLLAVRRSRRARSGGEVVVWRAGEVLPVGSLPARRSAVGAVVRRRAGALVPVRRRPSVPATAPRPARLSRRPIVVRPRWRGRPSGPGVMLLLLAVMAVAVVAAAWWLHRLGSGLFAVLLLVVGLSLVLVLLLASSRTTVHSMSAEAFARLLADPRPAPMTPRPAAKPNPGGQDQDASSVGVAGAASVVVVGVSNHPRAGTAAPSALPSAASTPAVSGSSGRYALPGDRASIASGRFGTGAEVRR